MLLSTLMAGRNPKPDYKGYTTADDMVLAVALKSGDTEVGQYAVVQVGITEASGALDAQTQDSQYLRTGKQTTKTSTSRKFNVKGDRYVGDEFQEMVLGYSVKYGTGSAVIRPYVYFNALTGKGEQGKISIVITDDLSGGAGDNGGFTANLTSTETPKEYTYDGTPNSTVPDTGTE